MHAFRLARFSSFCEILRELQKRGQQNNKTMREFNIYIKGYNMNGICAGCLADGRKMFTLPETTDLFRFLADIEIPVGVSVQLCWECTASAVAVKRFGKLVQTSFQFLKVYSRKDPFPHSLPDLSEHHKPRLTITKCRSENIASSVHSGEEYIRDDTPDQIKVENEYDLKLEEHGIFKNRLFSAPHDLLKQRTTNLSIDKCHKEKTASPVLTGDEYVVESAPIQVKIEKEDCMEFQHIQRKNTIHENISNDGFCNGKYKKESDTNSSVAPNSIPTEERMVVGVNPEDILTTEYGSDYLNLAAQLECTRQTLAQKQWKPKNKNTENKNQTYICEFCGKKFNDRVYIIRHLRKHTGVGSSNCHICMKKFATNGHLEKHYMMHTGERPFVCSICTKSFIQKQSLIDHQMLHTGEKPHKCYECNKSFIRKRSLQDHKCNGKSKQLNQPHICRVCSKEFRLRRHLQAHMAMHTGERPYVCNLCDKSFTRTDVLNQHKISHSRDKKHSCHLCTKCFKYKSGLVNHLKMHNNEKLFACHLCGKRFLRSVYLTEHLERHSNPNSRLHHNTSTLGRETEQKNIGAFRASQQPEAQKHTEVLDGT